MEKFFERHEVKATGRRWIFLVFLGLLLFMTSFNHASLSEIHGFPMSDGLEDVGWLVGSHNAFASLLTTPFISWLVFRNILGFRRIILGVSTLLLLDHIFLLIHFIKPNIKFLLLIGRSIGGLSNSIARTIPPAFAVMWFPETQIGLTIGLANVGISLGNLKAYVTFLNPSSNSSNLSSRDFDNASFDYKQWFSFNISTDAWNSSGNLKFGDTARSELGLVYIIFTFLTFVILVLFCFIATDLPTHPPSPSQLEERKKREEGTEDLNCNNFAQQTKKLIANFVFVFYGIAHAFVLFSVSLQDALLKLLISATMPTIKSNPQLEAAGKYLVAIYLLSSIIGSLLSGILLDRFKRYTMQASAGAAFSFVFSLLILLNCYAGYFVFLCISVSLFGLATRFSLIALVDSILQHNHPTNPLFLVNWLGFFQSFQTILLNLAKNLVFLRWGTTAALLILQSTIMFTTIVLSLVVRPSLNRVKTENKQTKREIKFFKFSEKDSLIRR